MIDNDTKEAYGIEMILEGLDSVCRTKGEFARARKAVLKDILLDSLIDHYDRNPSNLSVIRTNGDVSLSPKYDNGTSLSISVPREVLQGFVDNNSSVEGAHKDLRAKVYSKIGYLGRKYVKYPELETYIFNYYYDDVKDFIQEIQEMLTDENIDAILDQDKYQELDDLYRQIIKGKLVTNRDCMLQRFNIVSKKNVIDRIIYSKAARTKFLSHVQKGTITEIIPEYAACIGMEDEDTDYSDTLDIQIAEKIQTIVDITQLSRYLGVSIDPLTPREKSLLKWVTIIENLQKANPGINVYEEIMRLGFVREDKELIYRLIKDKFKDENDVLEAREIIYGENGVGPENLNLYIAKKFVDAAIMDKSVREERINSLKVFSGTLKEAVELENIVRDKTQVKNRFLQSLGLQGDKQICEVQFAIARMYRNNPRLKPKECLGLARELAGNYLRGIKEEILPGIFVEKEIVQDINEHTHTLKNGKKIALYDKTTKLSDTAFKMGIEYFGQIIEHPSGDGVTAYIVAKKGREFPQTFVDYARRLSDALSPQYGKGAVSLKVPPEFKGTSCFIVSSLKNPNARIPNITVKQFTEKVVDLFNEKDIDKSIDFE